MNYIKTLQLGSLMSIETLKDLADSTSAPVTGNVTILPAKIEFKLGETWEEYTADGRYTQTTATVEGDSLVKFQVLGQHTTYEIRQFKEEGKEMLLHLVIPAKPDIICKRVYKRLPDDKEEEEFGLEENR